MKSPSSSLIRQTLVFSLTILGGVCSFPRSVSLNNNTTMNILTMGYSKELITSTYDTKSQSFGENKKEEGDENMTFSVFDSRTKSLYVIHEVDSLGEISSGVVSRWIKMEDGSNWVRKQALSTEGVGPAHVALDTDRNILYVSNYGGSSFTAFSLNSTDGSIGDQIYTEQFGEGSHADPDRQDMSRPHGAFLYDQWIYLVDLGSDKIHHYRAGSQDDSNAAVVSKADPSETSMEPASGPRHLAVDKIHKRLYVLNELKNTLVVYRVNEEDGKLFLLNTIPYVIPDAEPGVREYGAEIRMHPSEHFVYASNRGTGAMLVYQVVSEAEGFLKLVQIFKLDGTWPRDFFIDPKGELLFVADQKTSQMQALWIDTVTGRLRHEANIECAEGASNVVVLN